MSIENKIAKAKPTTWVTDGIPKWQVCLTVWLAKLKIKLKRSNRDEPVN